MLSNKGGYPNEAQSCGPRDSKYVVKQIFNYQLKIPLSDGAGSEHCNQKHESGWSGRHLGGDDI